IGGGGWPLATLIPIYGPEQADDAAGASHSGITWSPQSNAGAALLAANQGAIDQLCRIAGRGHEPVDGETDAPIMTAWSSTNDFEQRLGPAVQAALADPAFAAIDPDHQQALRA